VGLLAHGSAVKGGFIAGCSDVDLQLFVDDAALTPEEKPHPSRLGYLPLELSLAVHRELAAIDPAPFSYIQCFAMGAGLPEGWPGHVPGGYAVLAGTPPVREATREELREHARRRIDALEQFPGYLRDGLLEHGDWRLQRQVRLLCTEVWPALYNLLVVQAGDPYDVWGLTKHDAIARLPEDTYAGGRIRAFLSSVLAYYPEQASVDDALAMVEHGVAFLHAVKAAFREGQELP
jgi:hypothetical protein